MKRNRRILRTRAFKVVAKRAKGPYPAVERREGDEEEPKLRKVPKARNPIPLKERSPATKVMDERKPSGDPRGDPVRFFTYGRPGKVGPKNAATNAVDLSGADSEAGIVLLSGNWFCNYSVNLGSTFTSMDPTTVFPAWKGHAFCCDQVVTYVPSIDRFVWFMQHAADGKGTEPSGWRSPLRATSRRSSRRRGRTGISPRRPSVSPRIWTTRTWPLRISFSTSRPMPRRQVDGSWRGSLSPILPRAARFRDFTIIRTKRQTQWAATWFRIPGTALSGSASQTTRRSRSTRGPIPARPSRRSRPVWRVGQTDRSRPLGRTGTTGLVGSRGTCRKTKSAGRREQGTSSGWRGRPLTERGRRVVFRSPTRTCASPWWTSRRRSSSQSPKSGTRTMPSHTHLSPSTSREK